MASIRQFFAEADAIFGFYFDIQLACDVARKRLARVASELGVTNDSPFAFSDGPPTGDPDEEIARSLHSTSLGAVIARMSDDGEDVTRAAEAAIIFVFQIWEEKYRRNLVRADGSSVGIAESHIMGDLRLIRNSLIHNKGIAADDISKCRMLKRFTAGRQIRLRKHDVATIVRLMKRELASFE